MFGSNYVCSIFLIVVLIVSLQFETVLLALGSLSILLDEMYESWFIVTFYGSRNCYSDKYVLPFIHEYVNRYALKRFHSTRTEPAKIDEIFSDDKFATEPIAISYLSKPVVIRNVSYLLESKAVNSWSREYWYNNYGSHNITIVRNNTCFRSKFQKLRNCPHERHICSLTNLNYAQFIDETDKNNQDLYVKFQSGVIRDNPELLNMINFNDLQNIYKEKMNVGDLFMSSNAKYNSNALMHRAVITTAFIQIKGSKKWIFVEPKYTPYLKPYPFYLIRTIYDDWNTMDKNIFDYISRYEVTLYPGDILLFPPMWWHAVKNEPGWNIGISMRSISPLGTLYQDIYGSLADLNSAIRYRVFSLRKILQLLVGNLGTVSPDEKINLNRQGRKNKDFN